MDFEYLQKALHLQGGMLRLQASTLDDAHFHASFQGVWDNTALEIMIAETDPREQEGLITLMGKATLPPIGTPPEVTMALVPSCGVTASFALANGAVRVILDFALPAPISSVFPFLPY